MTPITIRVNAMIRLKGSCRSTNPSPPGVALTLFIVSYGKRAPSVTDFRKWVYDILMTRTYPPDTKRRTGISAMMLLIPRRVGRSTRYVQRIYKTGCRHGGVARHRQQRNRLPYPAVKFVFTVCGCDLVKFVDDAAARAAAVRFDEHGEVAQRMVQPKAECAQYHDVVAPDSARVHRNLGIRLVLLWRQAHQLCPRRLYFLEIGTACQSIAHQHMRPQRMLYQRTRRAVHADDQIGILPVRSDQLGTRLRAGGDDGHFICPA